MTHDLWISLCLWQRSPGAGPYRPLMLDLLQIPGVLAWRDLQDRAQDRGWRLPNLEELASLEEAETLRRSLSSSLRRGWHLLTPVDDDYPSRLLKGMDPPLCLTVAGSLDVLHEPAVSVVGSREATVESLLWMEQELGEFLSKTKTVLVSGGARGVDQKAHSLALRNSCPTIAFLPSGLDCLYPPDLADWVTAIVDGGGALVSEYPNSLRMARQNFHQRNRLIAAQGLSTLIVEARPRSGTLITATRAAEIGRSLWVVPGHPQKTSHGGNLQLLAEGATMVRHAEDLILFWQIEKEQVFL